MIEFENFQTIGIIRRFLAAFNSNSHDFRQCGISMNPSKSQRDTANNQNSLLGPTKMT